MDLLPQFTAAAISLFDEFEEVVSLGLRSSDTTLFLRLVKVMWSALFFVTKDFLRARSLFFMSWWIPLSNHGRDHFFGLLFHVFVCLLIRLPKIEVNLFTLWFKVDSLVMVSQFTSDKSFSKSAIFDLGIPVVFWFYRMTLMVEPAAPQMRRKDGGHMWKYLITNN